MGRLHFALTLARETETDRVRRLGEHFFFSKCLEIVSTSIGMLGTFVCRRVVRHWRQLLVAGVPGLKLHATNQTNKKKRLVSLLGGQTVALAGRRV